MAIAVRIHKTLELADDKYYMITCGRAGFQNLENKPSQSDWSEEEEEEEEESELIRPRHSITDIASTEL